MGTVIHGDSETAGGVSSLWKFTATNYADLLTKVGMIEGDLAIVYASQGVWFINRKIKGFYMFQSGVWVYANEELILGADKVSFIPDGDIIATNVQDAIVEVRNDADIKIAFIDEKIWETTIIMG